GGRGRTRGGGRADAPAVAERAAPRRPAAVLAPLLHLVGRPLMIPLVDMHCHLLAGLDDGPRTEDDAVAMCRLAGAEGVRWMAATAHQNECYPAVTPDAIRAATARLRQRLADHGL